MAFWKSTLKAVAPTIGNLIGGPLGQAAVKVASKALGLGEDTTEEILAKKIETATPAELLALKQADNQFAVDMKKLDVDFAKIDAEDRSNARAREIALKDWVVKVLALGVFGVFCATEYLLVFHQIPMTNKDMFNQILGIMYGAVGLVLSYYFGSSHGSQEKDKTISTIAKNGNGH